MSLVDYDSSSEEEEEEEEAKVNEVEPNRSEQQQHNNSSNSNPTDRVQTATAEPAGVPSPTLPTVQLPDASLLFSSSEHQSQQVSGSDHSSRVAAAMSLGASRKRESNGSAPQFLRSKHPRGNLPQPRNVPGRSSGFLPPQLLGRSNVATEDISKLFVKKHGGSS